MTSSKTPLYRPEMLVFGDILRIWHYTALPKDLGNTRLMGRLRSVMQSLMGSLMRLSEQPPKPFRTACEPASKNEQ